MCQSKETRKEGGQVIQIHLFFQKYLLNTYHVQDSVLVLGYLKKKTDKIPVMKKRDDDEIYIIIGSERTM